MKITRDKKGQVRVRYTVVEKVDVSFPPKTWKRLKKAYKEEDIDFIILWSIQHDLEFNIILKVLEKHSKEK